MDDDSRPRDNRPAASTPRQFTLEELRAAEARAFESGKRAARMLHAIVSTENPDRIPTEMLMLRLLLTDAQAAELLRLLSETSDL